MNEHDTARRLRLLSFNMQVGVGTKRYREYLTRGWRHFLPSLQVQENLGRIAELVADYDIVGLQEIDAGSRRSAYRNQIEWLAGQAGFDFWYAQVNRDFGQIAQHGLGLLSRFPPFEVTEHKLPGPIPGRGALRALFGDPDDPLAVVVSHLALTKGTRRLQLAAITELLTDYRHAIVMADTNCVADRLRADPALAAAGLQVQTQPVPTFPSWRPRRGIDHILTTPGIGVRGVRAVEADLSDHLPVAMEVELPDNVGALLDAELRATGVV
ncbi:endonuclease/exonuclease/phosphatase [Salinisphaera sp. PC39]|uniref:endonuclease/exonuclease/phosphatase family protein n=1 Tax=Salinisphaera sp. PC39 TaxID=1304156 RepID=UPI00333F1FA6